MTPLAALRVWADAARTTDALTLTRESAWKLLDSINAELEAASAERHRLLELLRDLEVNASEIGVGMSDKTWRTV